MSVAKKRERLRGLFRSSNWADKIDKMTDAQVRAVHLRPEKEKK